MKGTIQSASQVGNLVTLTVALDDGNFLTETVPAERGRLFAVGVAVEYQMVRERKAPAPGAKKPGRKSAAERAAILAATEAHLAQNSTATEGLRSE